jgi:hypothetical protein
MMMAYPMQVEEPAAGNKVEVSSDKGEERREGQGEETRDAASTADDTVSPHRLVL